MGTKSRISLVPVRQAPRLPAILFEDDQVPLPPPPTGHHPPPIAAVGNEASDGGGVDGFGGLEAQPGSPAVSPGPLPASYGTGSIWLAARDPFLVLAHWDFAPAQLAAAASGWGPGGWQLRLHQGEVGGRLVTRRALPAASGEAFLPVTGAGCRYVVELGYETVSGTWFGVAMSSPAATPVELAPIFPGMPGAEGETWAAVWADPAPVARDPGEDRGGIVEWMDVSPSMPAEGMPSGLPDGGMRALGSTAPDASESGLAAPSEHSLELSRTVWRMLGKTTPGSSGESTVEDQVSTGLRRSGVEFVPGNDSTASDAGSAADAVPSSGDWAALAGGGPAGRGFWFELNAELIVYGRTEKDARVTVAGRNVALRDDGSFSFRFVLPDGEHAMPVVAVSAAGDDQRTAALRFVRTTRCTGDVGKHPQDPALLPPVPEAIG